MEEQANKFWKFLEENPHYKYTKKSQLLLLYGQWTYSRIPLGQVLLELYPKFH
jgi:hypothetical protein